MPSCGANGSDDGARILESLHRARSRHGLGADVFITETRCLGACPRLGATLVVYPEATWYVGVTADDVDEIVASHMLEGRVVERLASAAWRIRR
jgi:(2Fe-2S) ferredoxin